jgi:hypothetical protein
MKTRKNYDLTYATIDSLAEGVGSSQILPLVSILAKSGLSINLITYEKSESSADLANELSKSGIDWNRRDFNAGGLMSSINRAIDLTRQFRNSEVIHARSDVSAVAAGVSMQGPVLWDVRSLWAEQRSIIAEDEWTKRTFKLLGGLESFSSFNSRAMSTLTKAIVPVLEERHFVVPKLRTVVPTAVDLQRFSFSPKVPKKLKGLYSGSYNNYYDLELSRDFLIELEKIAPIEVNWAKPRETSRASLNAGESSSFFSTQAQMAQIIPEYSFGLSICKLDVGPTLKAAMPTKIAEFLACGRPVVVSKGLGDFDEFFSEFPAGVVLNGSKGDNRLKARQLLNLISNPETPAICRALAEKYFDINKGAQNYLDIYGRM